MSRPHRPIRPFILAAALLGAAPCFGDGVSINVTNDGTDDIIVSIYDATLGPRSLVLTQRMNGFTTIPLTLTASATGRANIAWTAVTVDQTSRRCGKASQSNLADAAAVTVHVDSSCGG